MDSRESVGSELVSEGGRFQQFVSKLLKYPEDIIEKPASHCNWVCEKLYAYLSHSSSPFRFAQSKTQIHLLFVLIPWLLSCLRKGGLDPNVVQKELMILSSLERTDPVCLSSPAWQHAHIPLKDTFKYARRVTMSGQGAYDRAQGPWTLFLASSFSLSEILRSIAAK